MKTYLLNQIKEVNLLTILLGIICIIILTNSCDKNKDIKELKKLIESSNSKMEKSVNDLGQTVGRIKVNETRDPKDFVNAVFTDPQMLRLQKLVKDNNKEIKRNGSAIILDTRGAVESTTGTVVTVIDTLEGEIKETIYSTDFSDDWIEYSIKASSSNIDLRFSYKDSYNITIGDQKPEKGGFFKRNFGSRTPYADVTSLSPYSDIEDLRVFNVNDERKPSRWGITAQLGYGFILGQDSEVHHGFSGTVGLSRILFAF